MKTPFSKKELKEWVLAAEKTAAKLEAFYGDGVSVSIDSDGSVHIDAPIREVARRWEDVWAVRGEEISKKVFTTHQGPT